MYRYHEEDLSEEELYLKGQLVYFIHELGFVGGVILTNLDSKTRLKIFIQTQ